MHGGKRGGSTGLHRTHAVTIRDLANELGLSITTISRALNGYDDVGAKTRERVRQKADELGYRPNRNAQRLVMQRTRNLAWIQSADESKMLDPHFVEVMSGVLSAARSDGYDIILGGDTEERQVETYDRYVRDNSVDGFIVDLPSPNDPRIDYLLEQGKPFVVHGRNERHDQYDWVDIDNHGNFKKLIELLVANGHTRIAFINGDERYSFALARHQGVSAALKGLGLPPETVDIYNSVHPMGHSGYQLTQRALEKSDITAIIYSSVLMANEGQTALSATGRIAGENICIATMDDQLSYLDISHYADTFTFVRSSLRDAGVKLVQCLIEQCEKQKPGGGHIIDSRFIIGSDLDGSPVGLT